MEKNFNEVLKEREKRTSQNNEANKEMALDDTQRVKVLSPGRLVFNRFMRNKLAVFGGILLIVMFSFAFIGPIVYPYGQTEIFHKYDSLVVDYATASYRTDYASLVYDDSEEVHYAVKNSINSEIKEMTANNLKESFMSDEEGNSYLLKYENEGLYSLSKAERILIGQLSGYQDFAKFNTILGEIEYLNADNALGDDFIKAMQDAIKADEEEFQFGDNIYRLTKANKAEYQVSASSAAISYEKRSLGEEFEALVNSNIEGGSFTFNNSDYMVTKSSDGSIGIYQRGDQKLLLYAAKFVFDSVDPKFVITDEFKKQAYSAYASNNQFDYEGVSYTIAKEGEDICIYNKSTKELVADFTSLVVRAYSGEDTMSYDFKETVKGVIEEMVAAQSQTSSFTCQLPKIDENANIVVDENGEVTLEDTTIAIKMKKNDYIMTCEQTSFLIDIYGRPSSAHIFGTDGDGMDVLARMMYGGRVSLLVCFIVVIIEAVLGVIMGGIAGYFGGWIDNLIMRIVDIFYCIPSLPILIILGAMFDALKMEPYVRLVWLMALLGFLGWATYARLVRGQILSLREQEFMIATEATGIRTNRRIFKHLVPNVMPQLIVTATSGLGNIIITESTLSFLGLGVKHPLATWGTMINSVTASSESMIQYTYIWLPVGALICLTVIAFNFVGDGLRDAFDPHMKR